MTNEQLIEKFNPLNAANVSAEELEFMHNLTDEQIDVLANAYPNQPQRRAYIRLYDKNVPANKQVFNLSTWQNLRNLRKFNNRKNLIAWDFFSVAGANRHPVKAVAPIAGKGSPRKVVVDLSAKEAAAEVAASVNKPAEGANTGEKKPAAKVVKAATGKGKGADKSASTGAAVNVEKPGATPSATGTPADQEFGNGDGDQK